MRKLIINNILKVKKETKIIEANNGEEAFEKFISDIPDLVFTDITMPISDGIELLSRIKQEDENAKVIICSAMGQEPLILESIKKGALDFIIKPFSAEKIKKVITKYL